MRTDIVSPRDIGGVLLQECEFGEINGVPTGEEMCYCNSYVDKGWIFLRIKRWMKPKRTYNIPFGPYCYTPKAYCGRVYHVKPCPYFWTNPLGYGDCSFLSPKWKFWRWNGWKNIDFALDDQCKVCNENNK